MIDFSKAIAGKCAAELNRLESDIKSKLNDPNWVRANNTYDNTQHGFQSDKKQFTFTYNHLEQGILVTAEIKKRLEALKWRVVSDATNQNCTITINR